MTEPAQTPSGPNKRRNPRRHPLLKLLIGFLLVLLSLLVLLLGALALLFFNERFGTWAVSSLNRWVPQLELHNVSGTLGDGLTIESLRYSTESFRLDIQRLSSRWQLRCLRQSTFCLDYLRADKLAIWSAGAEESDTDEPFDGVSLPEINIPWQFNVEQLRVEQFTWQSGEKEPIDFGMLDIRGVLAGHEWALHQVQWRFEDDLLGRGDLELAGHLTSSGNYPIRAELQGQYAPPGPEVPFERWQLRVDGDLSELAVDLYASGRGVARMVGKIDLTQGNLPLRVEVKSEEPIEWRDLRIRDAVVLLSGSLDGYELKADTLLKLPEQPELGLSLRGQGSLEELQVARLRASLDEASVTLQGQLNWTEGVHWQGSAKLARIDPSLWVPEWPGKLSGRLETEFRLRDERWALALNDLAIEGNLREQPVSLSGSIRRGLEEDLTLRDLVLSLDRNRIFATGQVNEDWSLTGDLDLPDLNAFWPELRGALQGSWQVQGVRADPRVRINARSPVLALGDNRVETVELNARVAPLTLDELELELSAARGQIAGETLTGLRLTADGRAEDHRVYLETGYQGYRLTASAQGHYAVEERDWQGVLRGLTLGHEGNGNQAGWLMTQRDSAALRWQAREQRVRLEPLCLADSRSSLCASFNLDGDAQSTEATLDLERFLMARIQPLLEPFARVAGTVTGKGRVALRKGKPHQADLVGKVENLRIARIGEKQLKPVFQMPLLEWSANYQDDQLRADIQYRRDDKEHGRIVGSVERPLTQPELDVELDLSALDLSEIAALAGLEQILTGTLTTDLQVRGDLLNPELHGQLQALDISMRESMETDPWFKYLDVEGRFSGTAAELDLSVTAPAHLQWRAESPAQLSWQGRDRFSLDPSCWTARDSRLCLRANWSSGQNLLAQLDLNTEAATALTPLLPEGLQVKGATEVRANLVKEPERTAQLTLKAGLREGQVVLSRDNAEPMTLPFDSVLLNAELADRRIVGGLEMASDSLGAGSAEFNLPLEPSAPAQAQWNIGGIEVVVARPFFPQISELGGRLGLSGTLGGTLEDPRVNGSVRLSDAHFASPTIPVTLDDLDAEVQIHNNQVSLAGTFSSGEGRGTLDGGGVIGSDWRAELSLKGTDIPVVQRPEVNLVVQPDFTLKAKTGEIFLGGRLEVTRGLLELKPLPASAVEVSSDVVFVDERGQIASAEDPWLFRTNLTLVLKDQVQLRGFGAQGKMKGSVTVIQDERNVLIGRGTLDIVEGRYERFGQRLKIRRGQILFNGPIERPYVTIEAVRETETVVAGLRLTGPIDEPTLSLFSEPPLPDDTIMYYLLTGNAPGSGVGDDQAIANRAMLSLGLYGGTPIAEQVAEKFGVEDFDITTSGQGDATAVNVSGYLSPRLFVQYGISVFSPVNTLTLRYRLRPNLFVEAVSGVENIMDLLYTFEF